LKVQSPVKKIKYKVTLYTGVGARYRKKKKNKRKQLETKRPKTWFRVFVPYFMKAFVCGFDRQ